MCLFVILADKTFKNVCVHQSWLPLIQVLEIDAFLSHDCCQTRLCQGDTFHVIVATEQDVEIGGRNLTMLVLSLSVFVCSQVDVGPLWICIVIQDIDPFEFVAVDL
jgi:hypothetical protein